VQNIEVKTRLAERAKVEKKLSALGARPMWVRTQKDTFFVVSEGWLKLRESEGKPAELISYRRSSEHSGPRPSDYDVLLVGDGAAALRLLSRVLPIDRVVEKERTLWIYEHTRVHLDRVAKLGEFLELETVVEPGKLEEARAENARIVETLGLEETEFVAQSYRDLLGR